MNKIFVFIFFAVLSSRSACAGSGFSIWEKLAPEDSVANDDMFAIADVSDTTQSADGSSKSVTGTQLKTFLQIYDPPAACTASMVLGTGGRNMTRSAPNPIDPLSFESDGSYNCLYNNFWGIGAGDANTSGNLNFFAGWNAGNHNTIGDQNLFIGARAGDANTDGYHNTYLGIGAGQSNVRGKYNVMIGTDSGLSFSEGDENVLVGDASGNTGGSYMTLVGHGTGYSSSTNTGYLTAVGRGAGAGLSTGTGGVYIGASAGTSVDGVSNQIAIGKDAVGSKSNQVVLGNSQITETLLRGKVGINTTDPAGRLDILQADNNGGGTIVNMLNSPYNYEPDRVQGVINFKGSAGASLPLQYSVSSIKSVKDAADGTGGTRLEFFTQLGSTSAKKMSVDRNGAISLLGTVTAALTTGDQTINKPVGSVNLAASASSLTVTNSIVTASSVINCTVGTNDTTMKSASCVAGAGSFVIYPDAAPTAETRVNFSVANVL